MKKSSRIIFSCIIGLTLAITPVTYGQMPDAITIEPVNATVYDEITLTFDPAEACFQSGSLSGLPGIAMHSGVTINGSTWQNVIVYNGTGVNGQPPTLSSNPDGTFSIVYTPYDFYGFAVGANVTQICAVFNNGTDWTQDGRDFQPGGTNCMDFFIPILPGIPPLPGINSIVPNQGEQGALLNVNIFGINTHFQNAGTVTWLSLLSDSIGIPSLYAVNDTLISAQLSIPVAASVGFWDVNVANPVDGLMTLTGGFEVKDDTIPVYPFAITLSPANASAYDEVTLTLDARLSCPEGALFEADSVMMHSGVTIGGSGWQYVVNFDGLGANGQPPKLIYNGDTTWSIVFTPLEFYGVPSGTYVEAVNCVFNGGAWTAGEAKDFDDGGNCIDFVVPLAYATGIKSVEFNSIKLFPNPAMDILNVYSESPLRFVTIINCQGKEVSFSEEVTGIYHSVDIQHLLPGIYLLRAEGADGSFSVSRFIHK